LQKLPPNAIYANMKARKLGVARSDYFGRW